MLKKVKPLLYCTESHKHNDIDRTSLAEKSARKKEALLATSNIARLVTKSTGNKTAQK